jgi:glutamate/aspartate transport system substrate-binding protein
VILPREAGHHGQHRGVETGDAGHAAVVRIRDLKQSLVEQQGAGKMRVLVLVPTAGSVIRVVRLEELRDDLPASQVILSHGYRPLDGISADYHALTAGPLAKLLRPAKPGRYLLRLSGKMSGNSWELPVLLAHLVVALGGELAEEPAQADIVLWATGSVDADLRLNPHGYRLAEKVVHSQAELLQVAAAGARIIAMVPASEDASRLHGLLTEIGAQDFRVVSVENVRDARGVLEQALCRAGATAGFQAAAEPEPAAPAGTPETRSRFWKIPILLAAAAVLVVAVAGDIEPSPEAKSVPASTLARVEKTGKMSLGYRNAAIPFSYVDPSGQPVGYSIDICKAIVDEIGRRLGRHVESKFVEVTLENRFQKLVDGTIDLECSSSTDNPKHRELADFSPLIFLSGTKLVVPITSGWRNVSDLKGRKVAVTRGATNVDALRELEQKYKLGIELVKSPSHEASYGLLARGEVDAFAADAVLLYGLIAKDHASNRFMVIGEDLSYEPYGIAFRRNDPKMRDAVKAAVDGLVITEDIDHLYTRWFESRLPGVERLDMLSPQLKAYFDKFRRDSKPPVPTAQNKNAPPRGLGGAPPVPGSPGLGTPMFVTVRSRP